MTRSARMLRGVRLILAITLMAVGVAYIIDTLTERAGIVDLQIRPTRGSVAAGVPPGPERLRPRDLPSSDVREHVTYVPQGGPGCAFTPTSRPSVIVPKVGFVGSGVEVCFGGFKKSRPVYAVLKGPHGQLLRKTLPAVGRTGPPSRQLPWEPLPGAPVGRYLAFARQGDRSAKRVFRVAPSPRPFARVRDLDFRRDGPLQLIVGGAPPRASAPVHVYREWGESSRDHSYLSTVRVPTDRTGSGMVRLEPIDGSTYTCYMLQSGFGGETIDPHFCFNARYG